MILLSGSTAPAPVLDPGIAPTYGTRERYGVRWEWEAPWLNRVWTITDNAAAVLRLRGATFSGRAPFEHYWSDSVALPGSKWAGGRYTRGELFLPLVVKADESLSFLAEHDAFQLACDPERESVLRSIRPDGQVRQIFCRYVSGAEDTGIDVDPVRLATATYGVTWATPDPFWSGQPVRAVFAFEAPPLLLPAPPFIFGSAQSLGNAAVVNPGDVGSYPVWRINGPFTSFSVGIGAAVVTMTITRAANQWVEINMTPGISTFLDQAGVDVGDNVTAVEFVPIPTGTSPVVSTVAGAAAGTTVELTFTPRYRTAW